MRRICIIGLFFLSVATTGVADTWNQSLSNRRAQLDVHWYTSLPFIYKGEDGKLTGVEYEIMLVFQEYLKEEHGLDLNLNWIEANNFYSVIETIRDEQNARSIGVSALSITEERKKMVKYTQPYLPDITVLVSSQGTPIVRQYNKINKLMEGMVAITIKGTVYENFILDLKSQFNADFEIRYINSDKNVLDFISHTKNSFGFIDLPIYLMWIKNGIPLVRQNFFTVRGTGYGFIMPLSSDWDIPFKQFLGDAKYKERIAGIIGKHIGTELYDFIGTLYDGEPLSTSILTKEKEIQLALIKNANVKLKEDEVFEQFLMIGIVVTLLFLSIIGVMLYSNQKNTKLLILQKNKIESQQSDIWQKNDQLLNRNAKLLSLNEEKNQLVSILAHDLRSPLNHILGLSEILLPAKEKMSEEDQGYLEHMTDAASRMRTMIDKILPSTLEENHNLVMRESVNLNQIINDIAVRCRPIAAKKNIDFFTFPCTKNSRVETDHMLLFLVLENLMTNAMKFSQSGTKVSLGVDVTSEEVLFEVTDEGPGFTDEDKGLLFNQFEKLSAKPTGGESSTGLGLSIVKKYVSDLGGKVWLESQLGHGSTFFVSLPV